MPQNRVNPAETSLKISEIFDSIQGEGASQGVPTLFVRLALCNLRCSYCDTRYSWDFDQFRYEDEVRSLTVAELAARVNAAPSRRVVITGGEPLLQQRGLRELCSRLEPRVSIEIETNGTLMPDPALLARVTQWNVSPKLSNSGDSERARLKLDVLAQFAAQPCAYLKLVVRSDGCVAEADALVARLGWPSERVFFMPEARTKIALRERSPSVERASAERGFRFSSRLQLELWDGQRGK
jgi:7-carboxy-7-deazaguanine synthase